MTKRIIQSIITGLTVFLFPSYTPIDEAKNELVILIDAVKKADNQRAGISMNAYYKLFENHSTTKLEDAHKGYYSKMGKENFKLDLYGTTTIRNKEFLFIKDDSNQVIIISRAEKNHIKDPKGDCEKFLKKATEIRKLENTFFGIGFAITYKNPEGDNEKFEMYIDPIKKNITRLVFYYHQPLMYDSQTGTYQRKKPRLEINYAEIIHNPDFPKDEFSFSKILSRDKNGKWTIKAPYSEYELVDQTDFKLN